MTSTITFKLRNAPRNAITTIRDVGVAASAPVSTVTVAGTLPVTYKNIVLTNIGNFSFPTTIGNLYKGQVMTFYIQTIAGVTTLINSGTNTGGPIVLTPSAVNRIKLYGGSTFYNMVVA